MLTVTHVPMWLRKHHGEKGESRPMARVYDPVIRWLLGGLTGISGFFLWVLWNDHEQTLINKQEIAALQGSMEKTTSEIRQDLREIRRILESRNGH